MTNEQREILNQINQYAEEVLADIDPQKTPVSVQLDKLRPIMEEIATERNMTLEDLFILYMDCATEMSVEAERKLQSEIEDINAGEDTPFLFRR